MLGSASPGNAPEATALGVKKTRIRSMLAGPAEATQLWSASPLISGPLAVMRSLIAPTVIRPLSATAPAIFKPASDRPQPKVAPQR